MSEQDLRERILKEIDLSGEISDQRIKEVIENTLIAESKKAYIPIKKREELTRELFNSLRKLDILQEFLEDEEITEIMINGAEHIFIEKHGYIRQSERKFSSEMKLEDIIQQITAGSNRIVNEAFPIVDARLADGSRVNVVLYPVALNGPIVTIRRFPKQRIKIDDLIALGSLDQETADFLKVLVKSRYNIFISGGTGSGKTTFLNVLSDYIPDDERVITIEDNAELQLTNLNNLVQLEARSSKIEGCQEISIRDLIKTSLRMRPDRIIVGEVRGGEAIDFLQAVNTGHDGSISTGHANSSSDMMSRLETMALMGMELPLSAIQRQIASGIDMIIHLGRLRDKSRRVLEIAEVAGVDNGKIELNVLFQFIERGEDKDGKVEGYLEKKHDIVKRRKLEHAGYTL